MAFLSAATGATKTTVEVWHNAMVVHNTSRIIIIIHTHMQVALFISSLVLMGTVFLAKQSVISTTAVETKAMNCPVVRTYIELHGYNYIPQLMSCMQRFKGAATDFNCGPFQSPCSNGTCISASWICDGVNDCLNGGDEEDCWWHNVPNVFSGKSTT